LVERSVRALLVLTGHGLKDPSIFERAQIHVEIASPSQLVATLAR
jgi:uncharacterized protein YjiS (DUF1127 family)